MSVESVPGVRQRLLGAAVELLGERGPEGTTLREIARRAGVSHGAPARHFPGLVALLSEVAAGGFRELEAAVDGAAGGPASDDPRVRLAAGGRGYVTFALGNPGVFGLMWRADLVDFAEPALAAAGADAFASLTRLVGACQCQGWRADMDTTVVAGSLWATVHGLAQLWLFGVLGPASGATSIDDVCEAAFALLLDDPVPLPVPPPTRSPQSKIRPGTSQRRRR